MRPSRSSTSPGKSWSAYNWYKGNFTSLIQVNTDLPVTIDRALDLACHEGYPGHHVYNVLLEQHLVRDRGWVEFSVYPLFSPQSLIAEGTANYGIAVAFPGVARTTFERETLYPLAGLDPSTAERYSAVQKAVDELTYAGNEAARRYINGQADRAATAAFLRQWAMMPADRAEQRVKFFDDYRSYVINYNLGRDLVAAYIERAGGTPDQPDVRWREFGKLISSPRLPSVTAIDIHRVRGVLSVRWVHGCDGYLVRQVPGCGQVQWVQRVRWVRWVRWVRLSKASSSVVRSPSSVARHAACLHSIPCAD